MWKIAAAILSFLVMIMSGWVNRHQLIVIEFLEAENRLLKARLRGKRIRFTDAERALLANLRRKVMRKINQVGGGRRKLLTFLTKVVRWP